MSLLARAGRRSAALAQYEACRAALAEELRVAPEAETTALYEWLRAETTAGTAGGDHGARRGQLRIVQGGRPPASPARTGTQEVIEALTHSCLDQAQQWQQRAQELTERLEYLRNLEPARDVAHLAELCLNQLRALVPAMAATLLLTRGDRLLVMAYQGPLPQERVRGRRIPLVYSGYLDLARRRAPITIGDLQSDPSGVASAHGDFPCFCVDRARALLAVPLLIEDRCIGLVQLEAATPNQVTARHARIARALATQAAMALHNARLHARMQNTLTAMLHDALSSEPPRACTGDGGAASSPRMRQRAGQAATQSLAVGHSACSLRLR
jgi:transcriptional regulator with GAF, ATPase, and Fis domain